MADVVVYGDGTDFLVPPAFDAGSVTAVTAPSGYTVPDYIELDGMLVTVDSDGRRRSRDTDPWFDDRYHVSGGGNVPVWIKGLPYTVTLTTATADVDALGRLRRMINEPDATTYDDAMLAAILARHADDLNAAAAEIWAEKATVLAATAFDFRDPSGEYSRSQLVANAQKMVTLYQSQSGGTGSGGVGIH